LEEGKVTMSVKTASMFAGLATFVLVILLSVLAGFMQMVAMNGVTSTSQGFNAAAILAVCQSLVLLACVILARWLTKWLMTKFNWNGFLAVLVAVFGAVVLGVGISFLSMIAGILGAEVR
jgi:hypothetical protein